MKLDILNKSGQSAGRSADLPDDIFGIEPNEHAVYLAVKQYNAAQRQGTHKSKEKGEINIKVVENFTFDAPKTKDYVSFMNSLEVTNQKSILVTADYDSALLRSSGNIPNAHVVNAKDLNTYEILNANTLLITEGAIAVIKETFA